MKTLEHYDYNLEMKERLKGISFIDGEGLGKSHGYSYLHCRNLYQEMGEIMGLDLELNKDELDKEWER